mmetsp:Transcript_22444/g.25822  ORF Transcript_22444/g.25822 Transcript_22444/m.25822 type:complete len:129 (+) Transcript_22444:506-892(+)
MFHHMQYARTETSCSDQAYSALFKLTKKQALVQLKAPEYSDTDRRMYARGIGPTSRALYRSRDQAMLEYRRLFADVASRLLSMQQEIFKLQAEFHDNTKFDLKEVEVMEFAKLVDCCRMVEYSKEYSV